MGRWFGDDGVTYPVFVPPTGASRSIGSARPHRSQPITTFPIPCPRREVYFPLAGYAGPGFHNWSSGHILQDTDTKPLLRIRSPAKKTFGEVFGAATGVSDPGYRRSGYETTGQAAKPPL